MSTPNPDAPNIDIGPSMLAICWTLYSFSGLVVAGRVYTQLRIARNFGIGDILMIFSAVRLFSKTSGNTADSSRYLVSFTSACWRWLIIMEWVVTSSTWVMNWEWRQRSGSSYQNRSVRDLDWMKGRAANNSTRSPHRDVRSCCFQYVFAELCFMFGTLYLSLPTAPHPCSLLFLASLLLGSC
jgi:hypothetical protein